MKPIYKICTISAVLLASFFLSFGQKIYGDWTMTGPVAFPTWFNTGQINGIGRVVQLKFHPTDPQKMYAVSASGGLWITTNGGATWNKTGTDTGLPLTQCSSVCIDYAFDNVIYLSTGDPNYYSSGFGIYKSTDGGATWYPSNNGIGNRMAVQILMDPQNRNILTAATNDGIWKSLDSGANWTVVKAGGEFNDMVFKPGSSTVMYAVDNATFWRSTDAGSTWTQSVSVNPNPGNGGRIAVTPADSNYVYVGFVGSSIGSDATGKGGIIYRSNNSRVSFSLPKGNFFPNLNGYAKESPDYGVQGRYNGLIYAHRIKRNKVYLGAHVTWKSTNGGTSWTQLKNWWEECHTDMHQIITSPYDNTKLFNINDGGIFLSTNAGADWVAYSEGLSATEVYHMGQSNL